VGSKRRTSSMTGSALFAAVLASPEQFRRFLVLAVLGLLAITAIGAVLCFTGTAAALVRDIVELHASPSK
jgi:hypothetical protein